MYDSPATKIPKEEIERLTSGDVDFYEKCHKPIPAIIFDPITKNNFKTLQIVDLPLEISSKMNFPMIHEIGYLSNTDIMNNIGVDRNIHIEQVEFYLKSLVFENLVYYIMYDVFDLPETFFYYRMKEYFDIAYEENKGRGNSQARSVEFILSGLFSHGDPLDNPCAVMASNNNDFEIRRFARIEQATKQLTNTFSTIVCKATEKFVDECIAGEVLEARGRGDFKPENLIKQLYAENRKLVEESPVAHILAIKNYVRIKLEDFIMDTVYDLCNWVLVNSLNTFYYAMFDYYHGEVLKEYGTNEELDKQVGDFIMGKFEKSSTKKK